MGHISKIECDGKKILEIDYSNCKEAEMIALIRQAGNIGRTENRPFLVLSIVNEKNYLTPGFMKEVREIVNSNLHFIEKQAIVGLTPTQKTILKGLNIFVQRNFKTFDTKEEAVRFLLNKNTTDNDLPEYYQKK